MTFAGRRLARCRFPSERDPILSKAIAMMATPYGLGGDQEALCLKIDKVNGWLFTIDSSDQIGPIRPRARRPCRLSTTLAVAANGDRHPKTTVE